MNRNVSDIIGSGVRKGPAIRAVHPWSALERPKGAARQLLSDDERARLAVIASVVRFAKGESIYRADQPVDAIYNIISGVVKAFSTEVDGSEHIHAFLFADDLLGLSEEGRYVNSAEAITPVTAYQLPAAKLQSHLRRDAGLQFHVICKLCQELRQAQRHAFLISKREALPKLAMFLQLLEDLQAGRGEPINEIHLPMDRTEIAEFVGMSLAAVSRGFKKLATRGVIELRNRQHVKVKDRAAFEDLVDLSAGRAKEGGA
jgi:CRP/FNR family transcriptional regulator